MICWMIHEDAPVTYLPYVYVSKAKRVTHIDIELHLRKLDGDIIYFDATIKKDIDLIIFTLQSERHLGEMKKLSMNF